MAKKVKISVVIPTFNEEKYIRNVLEGLRNQNFKNFETIVVDSASSDRTRQIARRRAKVIIEKRKGIGLARNTGVRHARGEILLFTNADTKPSRALMQTYADAFRSDPKLVASTGPLLPLEKSSAFIAFGYVFASVFLAKLAFMIGVPTISGSNFAVRRAAFKKIGGFDESLTTYEDLDLSKRLKKVGRLSYIDDATVQTSTRRIKRWGVVRYILFNASNVLRYNLSKRSHSEYEYVR